LEVLEALDVRLHARDLRVGDEHDAIGALEDQLAARVVEHLAGHRVEVEANLVLADLAEIERQEVEEQRALGLRLERDHLAARLGLRRREHVLEVCRLPAQARAVIDDLAVDLLRQPVDEAHRAPRTRFAASVTKPCTFSAVHEKCAAASPSTSSSSARSVPSDIATSAANWIASVRAWS